VAFAEESEDLRIGASDGDDHSSAFIQLAQQWRRNAWRGSGYEDPVIRRVVRQAPSAVSDEYMDVLIADMAKYNLGSFRQGCVTLDRVNLSGEPG
jgi:hypothetical protein